MHFRLGWRTAATIVLVLVMFFEAAQAQLASRDSKIQKDDILYPKLAMSFAAGESSKVIEKSTFSVEMANPLNDRCEFRVRESRDAIAIGRLKRVDAVRIEAIQPRLEIDRFVADLKAYAPRVFSSMILQDQVEGIVFRKDDLKMEMNQILASEPLRQVPKTFRARLEQSLVTHLWGCYGDLLKYKSEASSVMGRRLRELKQIWSNRMVTDVETGLRSQAKARAVQSDQLAKTKVTLQLRPATANSPDPDLRIECVFEGSTKTFSVERLNAALSPHFELFSKQDFVRLQKQNALPMRTMETDSKFW